jgi:hypothetical protein
MRFTEARLAAFREQLLVERAATVRLMGDLGEDIRRIVDSRQDSNVDDEHDPEGSTIAFERSQSDALLRQSRGTSRRDRCCPRPTGCRWFRCVRVVWPRHPGRPAGCPPVGEPLRRVRVAGESLVEVEAEHAQE